MTTTGSQTGASKGPDTLQQLTGGTLVAAALAVIVAQVGLSIPAVLNGLFQGDLGTSSTQLTWISAAFLVPVTLFELTFGVMGDLFGRKRLLAGGTALVAAGAVLAFFTPGAASSTDTRVAWLLTGQVIAGIGAAAVLPTSVAMLAAGTHTAKARGHAISVWAAALTAAGFISPVAGGLLARLHHSGGPEASWRWAFLFLAALGVLSTGVTLALATTSYAKAGRSLDWPGQVTIAIALFGLLYAVIEGGEAGYTNPRVLVGLAVAIVFIAAFVKVERRTDEPLLDLRLFANRLFVVTAVVTVLGMFAYLGTAYSTSIRLSAIQGYSPLKTSIGFVCLNIMGVVLFPFSSWLIEKLDAGRTLALGMVFIAAGDLWIAAVPATNLSIGAIAIPLLLVGIGFKLAVTSITVVAVNGVPTDRAGMASGTTSMLRDFGLTLGPAVIGSIALSHASDLMAQRIGSSPSLSAAVAAFNAAPGNAPAGQRAALESAVGAVSSGPLGANGVPATITLPDGSVVPFNPLQSTAFHALSDAFSIGYLVCGAAALVAAVLALALLRGRHGGAPSGGVS